MFQRLALVVLHPELKRKTEVDNVERAISVMKYKEDEEVYHKKAPAYSSGHLVLSHLGLAFVLMLRPFFPELVMSTDLLSFEHPLLFCLVLQMYVKKENVGTAEWNKTTSKQKVGNLRENEIRRCLSEQKENWKESSYKCQTKKIRNKGAATNAAGYDQPIMNNREH